MTVAERQISCPTDTTLETLLATPEGQRIMSCIQCGTCAGACPYGEHMEYPPRHAIDMLWRGLIDEVIASGSLLRCVACYACMSKCPRGIKLTDVLLPLIK
jgi:heterodisulfide reductase subunit C